jgi:tRNA threonylcarbamoyladenosine biosynthesis protein TsaB
MGASRDDAMFPAVVDVLSTSALSPRELGAVVCGAGPGSFTSLRIAAALAKGMSHAAGIPLFAVSSLLLAAAAHREAGRYLVTADALRGERYTLPVRIDADGGVDAEGPMTRVAVDDLARIADSRLLLCVPGADGASVGETVAPDASYLPRVMAWDAPGPVSLQHWEPKYGRLAEAQVKWEAAHQQALARAE